MAAVALASAQPALGDEQRSHVETEVEATVSASGPEEGADGRGTSRAVAPRFELKRAMTNRGAPDESSRTTLRSEAVVDWAVTLLRLDVSYVDKNNDFVSDPLNAGLGDLTARVESAPLRVAGAPLKLLVEVVFPTGGALGFGKYLVGPGAKISLPLRAPWSGAAPARSAASRCHPIAPSKIAVGRSRTSRSPRMRPRVSTTIRATSTLSSRTRSPRPDRSSRSRRR